MTATTDFTEYDGTHGDGAKVFWVRTATAVDSTNTLAITLSTHGIKNLWYVEGYTHTTEGSVVVSEAPTTSVSAGVLTITVGGTDANDQRRIFKVVGN